MRWSSFDWKRFQKGAVALKLIFDFEEVKARNWDTKKAEAVVVDLSLEVEIIFSVTLNNVSGQYDNDFLAVLLD